MFPEGGVATENMETQYFISQTVWDMFYQIIIAWNPNLTEIRMAISLKILTC